MGCHSSKFVGVDDSIHVMLSHAKVDKPAYVPRQPHPLLLNHASSTMETDVESDDLDSLMFHSAHHNDTIDPRDMTEYGVCTERKSQKVFSS